MDFSRNGFFWGKINKHFEYESYLSLGLLQPITSDWRIQKSNISFSLGVKWIILSVLLTLCLFVRLMHTKKYRRQGKMFLRQLSQMLEFTIRISNCCSRSPHVAPSTLLLLTAYARKFLRMKPSHGLVYHRVICAPVGIWPHIKIKLNVLEGLRVHLCSRSWKMLDTFLYSLFAFTIC